MFFGIIVEGGKKYESTIEQTFHLSMACIEPSKNSEPVSLYCKTDEAEEEYLICSLDGQQTRQVNLDLVFIEGSTVSFSAKGKGKVHLTGYLTLEEDDLEFDENSEFDESEEEEVSEEELSPAKIPAGQKRAPAAAARPTVPVKKAKTQESPNQVANGKPATNGKSIPIKQESGQDEEEDEDSDDDDMSDDGELQRMLAGLKKAKNASPVSGGDMSVDDEDDEEDDDFDEDDEDDEDDDEEEEKEQQKKITHVKKDIKQNLQQKPQKGPQQHAQQQQQPKKPQHQQMNQKNTPGNTPGRQNFNQNKGKSPYGGKNTPNQQQGGGFKRDGNSSFNKNKARFSGQKFSGKKQQL